MGGGLNPSPINLAPGNRVLWYRSQSAGARPEHIEAVIVRRLSERSVVISVDGMLHTVRAENLMPAPARK